MKQHLALADLAKEIVRQRDAKRDFIARQGAIEMETLDDEVCLALGADAQRQHYTIRPHAHAQIASRLGVPKRYYDRMREEAPDLLTTNVNGWLERDADACRMVRTLDGAVRAFLSDRYQRIENEDIAEVALPVLAEQPDMRVESCAVTERRLYIKALFPRIAGEVAKGDVVQAGVIISNSEVGAGAIEVAPLLFRLVCLNGLIVQDHRVRGFHIGPRIIEGDDVRELLTDEARQADDRAILLKLRDVVRACADPAQFETRLERLRRAAQEPVTGDLAKAVEVLALKSGLNEAERGSVLRHLIMGGDLTRWGLVNAVTRIANDALSYDRATELEALGGTLLDLPRQDWREIAEAT
jgi:hypothetical protein